MKSTEVIVKGAAGTLSTGANGAGRSTEVVIKGLDQLAQKRTSQVFLHVGAKKTGKTQATLNCIVDMWRYQGKPCIVLDPGSQSEYNSFLPISLDELGDWPQIWQNTQIPFFRCRNVDIDDFFTNVAAFVKNSFVVYEDSTWYMTGNLSDTKELVILNSRNACNDYFFNLHSLAEPAPFLYRHSEVLILRKTGDNKDKLPPKVPFRDKIRAMMEEIDVENVRRFAKTEYKLAWRKLDLTSF